MHVKLPPLAAAPVERMRGMAVQRLTLPPGTVPRSSPQSLVPTTMHPASRSHIADEVNFYRGAVANYTRGLPPEAAESAPNTLVYKYYEKRLAHYTKLLETMDGAARQSRSVRA
jgi:hypothetical protein